MFIEFGRFTSDFYYNYVTTPVYGIEREGTSFLRFLLTAGELYGWPLCGLFVVALVVSCFLSFRRGILSRDSKFILLSLSVFFLYFVKFGAFPRMETRFALPSFPFLVLATGPFWAALRTRWAYGLATPFVVYGLVCSVLVGNRFLDDPRMLAQEWVMKNVPDRSDDRIIERTRALMGKIARGACPSR